MLTLDDLIRLGEVELAMVDGRVCMGFKPGAELAAQGVMWDYYFGDSVKDCTRQLSAAILHTICTQ